MKKPVLVIMAAGMGSRYGGLKQIDPVDEQGHIIMDFSVYDAHRAGFDEVVFIIKRENEQLFRDAIGDRVSRTMKVHYVFQDLEAIPEGYSVPEGRVKPWGTGHAVLCAQSVTDGPFAVINADDYYGAEAFRLIYDSLMKEQESTYTMVGYLLKNTLTENGSVARGVCTTDAGTWQNVSPDSVVSMNMWGFPGSFMDELKARFPAFLDENLPVNPLKCEYFLPFVVNDLMKEGKVKVRVLTTHDVWHGVTYAEDKQGVVDAMQDLKDKGVYPEEF